MGTSGVGWVGGLTGSHHLLIASLQRQPKHPRKARADVSSEQVTLIYTPSTPTSPPLSSLKVRSLNRRPSPPPGKKRISSFESGGRGIPPTSRCDPGRLARPPVRHRQWIEEALYLIYICDPVAPSVIRDRGYRSKRD